MMATFLAPTPQPGDGAWLLQQTSDRRRRGRGRNKLLTFLRETPDEYEQDEVDQNNGKANQPLSFLRPSICETTSPQRRSDEPRTIPDNELLLTSDSEARAPLFSKKPRPFSFLHGPTIAEYTTDSPHTDHPHSITRDPTSPAAMAKSVPPHLRTKAASATTNHLNTSDAKAPLCLTASDAIAEKLASDFGVKVSNPKPVIASASNGEESGLGSAAASMKPAEPNGGAAQSGIVAPNAIHTTQNDNRALSPIYRGRGRGGRASRDRDSRWPKPSEFPKPDPNRWDIKWVSEKSYDSSIDSAQADSGFGEDKKKRAHDQGGFKLADWNGGFAPAPIDWDARPAFRDPTKLTSIESWMSDFDEKMCGVTRGVPTDEVAAVSDEVAPQYWDLTVMGGPLLRQSPQTFWNEIIRSDAPKPMHDGDLDGVKPWWQHYKAPESIFLKPYSHPNIKGIDPDENQNEKLARENDYGADQHAQNRKRLEAAKRDKQHEKRIKTQEKARKFRESVPATVTNRDRIRPGSNLYVRSARPGDINQIRDIYNHYVDFSCCTPETERRTTTDMMQRYRNVLANRLPFLVACERGGKVPNRRRKRNPEDDLILPDRVVGFAMADDYNDIVGMYRFTAEIECYIHKESTQKSIAKCLLDKLMGLLDPEYVERGGFDIEGEELEGVGPSRVIKNIIANVPYAQPERLEWIGRWLSAWLGFKQVGILEDVGNKAGKRYVRRTSK